ncbi:hypothetical protein BKA62DRAFT_689336 [Auriculariales sp. MPI-PUGE-AT-0066]|nr:hypothetical protein BKA62DRAFT_689336 [Auriculariales sp. MPI-PUGE-AT-0066]
MLGGWMYRLANKHDTALPIHLQLDIERDRPLPAGGIISPLVDKFFYLAAALMSLCVGLELIVRHPWQAAVMNTALSHLRARPAPRLRVFKVVGNSYKTNWPTDLFAKSAPRLRRFETTVISPPNPNVPIDALGTIETLHLSHVQNQDLVLVLPKVFPRLRSLFMRESIIASEEAQEAFSGSLEHIRIINRSWTTLQKILQLFNLAAVAAVCVHPMYGLVQFPDELSVQLSDTIELSLHAEHPRYLAQYVSGSSTIIKMRSMGVESTRTRVVELPAMSIYIGDIIRDFGPRVKFYATDQARKPTSYCDIPDHLVVVRMPVLQQFTLCKANNAYGHEPTVTVASGEMAGLCRALQIGSRHVELKLRRVELGGTELERANCFGMFGNVVYDPS